MFFWWTAPCSTYDLQECSTSFSLEMTISDLVNTQCVDVDVEQMGKLNSFSYLSLPYNFTRYRKVQRTFRELEFRTRCANYLLSMMAGNFTLELKPLMLLNTLKQTPKPSIYTTKIEINEQHTSYPQLR